MECRDDPWKEPLMVLRPVVVLNKCNEYNERLYSNFFIAQKFLNEKKINISFKKLSKFQRNFDNILSSPDKYYLSRILIFKKYQNQNIGSIVIKRLFQGKTLYLHVKKKINMQKYFI